MSAPALHVWSGGAAAHGFTGPRTTHTDVFPADPNLRKRCAFICPFRKEKKSCQIHTPLTCTRCCTVAARARLVASIVAVHTYLGILQVTTFVVSSTDAFINRSPLIRFFRRSPPSGTGCAGSDDAFTGCAVGSPNAYPPADVRTQSACRVLFAKGASPSDGVSVIVCSSSTGRRAPPRITAPAQPWRIVAISTVATATIIDCQVTSVDRIVVTFNLGYFGCRAVSF